MIEPLINNFKSWKLCVKEHQPKTWNILTAPGIFSSKLFITSFKCLFLLVYLFVFEVKIISPHWKSVCSFQCVSRVHENSWRTFLCFILCFAQFLACGLSRLWPQSYTHLWQQFPKGYVHCSRDWLWRPFRWCEELNGFHAFLSSTLAFILIMTMRGDNPWRRSTNQVSGTKLDW